MVATDQSTQKQSHKPWWVCVRVRACQAPLCAEDEGLRQQMGPCKETTACADDKRVRVAPGQALDCRQSQEDPKQVRITTRVEMNVMDGSRWPSHLWERAQRVPHALHSTGMLSGPFRQHGESLMPQFMHGPVIWNQKDERSDVMPSQVPSSSTIATTSQLQTVSHRPWTSVTAPRIADSVHKSSHVRCDVRDTSPILSLWYKRSFLRGRIAVSLRPGYCAWM